MNKLSGYKWAKKAFIILSAAVVAIIWAGFFISLFCGRLSHGPIEETWFLEVLKWLAMTPPLVVIVDVIAYAVIMTAASGKIEQVEDSKDEEKK